MVFICRSPMTGKHEVKPFDGLIGEKKIAVGEEIEQDDGAIEMAVMQARSQHGGHFDKCAGQCEWRAACDRHATAFSRRP